MYLPPPSTLLSHGATRSFPSCRTSVAPAGPWPRCFFFFGLSRHLLHTVPYCALLCVPGNYFRVCCLQNVWQCYECSLVPGTRTPIELHSSAAEQDYNSYELVLVSFVINGYSECQANLQSAVVCPSCQLLLNCSNSLALPDMLLKVIARSKRG
ncbi:hypothetical protein EDB84DRAFT_1199034 [Lactarius hengduanensis]|nr:hypothetical protein EDB84DRAFT_1199034 [Lactarius hengduanensis]